ncbi:penicillin-binding protein [Salirhabdus salicampi]|uniref:penicillin-binding protein n=1 Tax=Salirhabdus salicampi TaxID=476102 RepID=UPI0020C36E5C|nr:penicillin-binding protein [Salirhabdus salicampi]MCP8616609.1 penicillin-binding protein [Salirhabdus salicampi]
MKKLKTTNVMAIALMLLFILVFVVMFWRLVYIQATGNVQGVDLQKWAEKQRSASYTLEAERGKILDRTGMVLADNRPSYRMYAIIDESYSVNSMEPLHVTDLEATAKQLAPFLNMSSSAIYQKLNQDELFQVEFGPNGRDLSNDVREQIENLDLPGIYFMKEPKRYYPNGTFASHVIGFTQKNDDGYEGIMGIEKSQEEWLKGTDGFVTFKRDNYTYKLLNPDEVVQNPEHGADVYLTLDQKIQTFLEDAMDHVQAQYEPERMMAVVMNPKTGEVLAMSNRPSFNPNDREGLKNWYNDVIAYPFEPGSTMKIFTLAAAIDSDHYDGEEEYQSGNYKILDNTKAIHDHKRQGWGEITYNEGVQRSSNVAFAKLVWEKMGTDMFRQYLTRFQLDQPTNIDIAGERTGKILYDWPIEKVTTAFGQGSTLTPMQIMKAATAIANNGKMMQPYVISKLVEQETGEVIQQSEPQVVGTPISSSTAKEVMDLLETVVTSEVGTGQRYQLEGYSVAGKTGTAQIPDPEGGGYLIGDENYVFSFLGVAPKEEPELMMYIAVKQPNLEKNEHGSQPVSYIFRTVMENSLHYLNIVPEKESAALDWSPIILSDYEGKTVDKVRDDLLSKNVKVTVIGDGNKVKSMVPKGETEVLPGSHVMVLTNGNPTMPDMTNWSLREVLMLGELVNAKTDYIGSGFVTKQNVPASSRIEEGQYIVVELTPPETEERRDEEGHDTDIE